MHRQRAFTIVELLIVIVVIAILAAITITAYNGIQERARMSRASSFAAQLKRANLNDAVLVTNFDDCSGNTSSSSTGPNPTVSGTLQWSTDTPSGTGCSLQFSNSQRLLYDVRLSSTYYLKSLWIKIPSCTGANNLISDGSSDSLVSTAFYAPSPDCFLRSGHNNSWTYVSQNTSIADAKWHHLAVEFTADAAATTGVMKLYKDGELVSSNAATPKPDNTATMPIMIGAHKSGNMLTGIVDDIMIVAR